MGERVAARGRGAAGRMRAQGGGSPPAGILPWGAGARRRGAKRHRTCARLTRNRNVAGGDAVAAERNQPRAPRRTTQKAARGQARTAFACRFIVAPLRHVTSPPRLRDAAFRRRASTRRSASLPHPCSSQRFAAASPLAAALRRRISQCEALLWPRLVF